MEQAYQRFPRKRYFWHLSLVLLSVEVFFRKVSCECGVDFGVVTNNSDVRMHRVNLSKWYSGYSTSLVAIHQCISPLVTIIVSLAIIMLRGAESAALRPTIRALLIDLSGTLHIATQPTPGSPDAIRRLRDSSIPFRFCSNTSKESTAALRDKLARMGIETHDNEVWTSIGAVNSLLRAKRVQRCVHQTIIRGNGDEHGTGH